MNYKGVIIEESLDSRNILNEVKILETEVEPVTPRMKTPWLKQWTLHTVEVLEKEAKVIASKIAKSLKLKEGWYADYKNDRYHYIIFRDKIFKVDRRKFSEYEEAKKYGVSLGIPEHQVNFTNDIIR